MLCPIGVSPLYVDTRYRFHPGHGTPCPYCEQVGREEPIDPRAKKTEILMNWPERVWIYSPVRVFFQKREVSKWLKLTGPVRVENALEIGCGLGKGAQASCRNNALPAGLRVRSGT